MPYKIAWDVEKTPAPASKEAKAALEDASAVALAAAKLSKSIRAPTVDPQQWKTNVGIYRLHLCFATAYIRCPSLVRFTTISI